MSLEIRQRIIEGITLLDLTGRLIVGFDASGLRQRVTQLIDGGQKNIVLNLKSVDFIDSTGLGTLVIGHSEIEKAGGALKLLNLTRRHIELLVLTKLTTIFEIFDDEQAAIDSFFPDRKTRRFDILDFVKSQEAERA